jgi:hypothetical protein
MTTTTSSAAAPADAKRHSSLFRFLFVHEIDE